MIAPRPADRKQGRNLSAVGHGPRLNLRSNPEPGRLTLALLLSLVIHAFLLSLNLSGQGSWLPGFSFPWQTRRAEVPDLNVVLIPAPVAASEPVVTPVVEALESEWIPVARERTPAPLVSRPPTPRQPEAAIIPEAGPGTGPAATSAPARIPLHADRPGDSAPPPAAAPPVIALQKSEEPTWPVPVDPATPMPALAPTPTTAIADTGAPSLRETGESARELARQEMARAEAARLEAERQEAVRKAAELQEATRQDAVNRDAARVQSARLDAERQEVAQAEAVRQAARQEAARQDIARQEMARQDASRQETARQETARQEAARQEAARQEVARQEAARQETARQEATRQEAARQELARQETARQEAARQEAARQEAARAEAARQDAARQEAARQGAALQDAARAEAQEAAAKREATLRAIGRQLDEEAARRDAAAASVRQSPSGTGRRYRLFGRTDPNPELILYAEAWSRKIESNLTIDAVREVTKQPHTDPVVTVAVRSDGSVESVTFVRSSGVAAIDDAIRRVVQGQTPYQAFPPGLAREYDVIEIRRTWYFDVSIRLY